MQTNFLGGKKRYRNNEPGCLPVYADISGNMYRTKADGSVGNVQ